jgi:hypothetical protein
MTTKANKVEISPREQQERDDRIEALRQWFVSQDYTVFQILNLTMHFSAVMMAILARGDERGLEEDITIFINTFPEQTREMFKRLAEVRRKA